MRNKDNYVRLRDSLLDITARLEAIFSDDEKSEVLEFIKVGEYGLAFDTICSIVWEEHKTLPPELYDPLSELGQLMELDPAIWTRIKPPE